MNLCIPRNIITIEDEPGVKSYGDIAFIDKLCRDLFMELIEYYGNSDGRKMYVFY